MGKKLTQKRKLKISKMVKNLFFLLAHNLPFFFLFMIEPQQVQDCVNQKQAQFFFNRDLKPSGMTDGRLVGYHYIAQKIGVHIVFLRKAENIRSGVDLSVLPVKLPHIPVAYKRDAELASCGEIKIRQYFFDQADQVFPSGAVNELLPVHYGYFHLYLLYGGACLGEPIENQGNVICAGENEYQAVEPVKHPAVSRDQGT